MGCTRYMAAGLVMLGAGALFAQESPPRAATAPAAIPAASGGGVEAIPQQYWFGVAVQNLPRSISRQLKLQPDQGLMVMMVLPDSPAAKAELRAEDVLIEIDGVPLTSYEELARAANRRSVPGPTAEDVSNGGKLMAGLLPGSSQITLLRDGDRRTLTLLPEPRPGRLRVLPANAFATPPATARSSQNRAGAPKGGGGMRTVVFSNGVTAQVGPGFPMDEASTVSIRHMVEKGQTLTFTQELDGEGKARHRLVVGNKSYAVDPAKIDALPEELRPFARQMLASMPTPPQKAEAPKPAAPSTRPAVPTALERRIQDLEKQNEALRDENRQTQRKLERLIELLEGQVNQ